MSPPPVGSGQGRDGRRRAATALRHGASATGRAIGRGTVASARLAGRGSKAGARRARAYTHSSGAGETGLARIIELHFVNLAGDAALTVSLAGTIFAIPTDEARGQVAQFLLLTMAPFALLAPFIGPLLDRFRHGRRWAIGTTLALRAFLCWVLAGAVANDSPWLFPAALGCLVASKAYGVTRASAVPRLLPAGFSLVNANSRNALAGVAGMAVGGGLAGAAARVGPEWSLRLAFVIYIVGTVLAIRLPARVDSSIGELDIEDTGPVAVRRRQEGRTGLLQRVRARVAALPTPVLVALTSAIGARLLTGFLTLFMAFLMREHPIPGHSGTLVLGLVVAAAGAGNALGTVIGNTLRKRRPDVIIAVALIADVAAALVAAIFYSLAALLLLGLVAGLAAQLIKLSSDAVVQRDIDERVRTRVFAWAETVLQIAWVVGGGIGISLPLIPQLGFGVIAGLLVVVLAVAVRIRMTRLHIHPAPAH
ncbi:MAG: MFS transporter [Pedococcus sp.]